MEVSFLCEWITPALWHGADPKGTPEVRSASLKGLLRYWWRAWVGGLAESSEEMYGWEKSIFGSTDRASPIIVHAYPEPLDNKPKGKGDKAWDIGQKWKAEFKLRYGYRDHSARGSILCDSASPLWWALGSFWLLEKFGGIGYGSRRENGRFRVITFSEVGTEKDIQDLLNVLWRKHSVSQITGTILGQCTERKKVKGDISKGNNCAILDCLMKMAKERMGRSFSRKEDWNYLILEPSYLRDNQDCGQYIIQQWRKLGQRRSPKAPKRA
ncbi:MAG: type III-B CRISPR module RAMP protein Cmr1 [Bacteroidia bacterium]|nr:type III-B CRISPR module RAMP protein Cmr1 [Bacteroidia bacterium]